MFGLNKALSIILMGSFFVIIGAGCINPDDKKFPPKPPIPGVERSPVIERLTPGSN